MHYIPYGENWTAEVFLTTGKWGWQRMEGNHRLLICVALICQENMPLCWKDNSTSQTVWRGAHVGAENLLGRPGEWQDVPSEDGADGRDDNEASDWFHWRTTFSRTRPEQGCTWKVLGIDCSAGVCTQDSRCTTFHIVRNGKWKCYGCSSFLESGDVGPGGVCRYVVNYLHGWRYSQWTGNGAKAKCEVLLAGTEGIVDVHSVQSMYIVLMIWLFICFGISTVHVTTIKRSENYHWRYSHCTCE